MKAVAESVMREIIGQTPIVEATDRGPAHDRDRGARAAPADPRRLRRRHPDRPRSSCRRPIRRHEVIDAFRDVQRAQADRSGRRTRPRPTPTTSSRAPAARPSGAPGRRGLPAGGGRPRHRRRASASISVYDAYSKAAGRHRAPHLPRDDGGRAEGHEQGDHRRPGRATASCPTCRCPRSSEGRAACQRAGSRAASAQRSARNERATTLIVAGVVAVVVAVVLLLSSLFTVRPDPAGARAAVRRPGPRGRASPGLHVKVPFIQNGRVLRQAGARLRRAARRGGRSATRSGSWSTPSPATGSSIRCGSTSRVGTEQAFARPPRADHLLEPAQRAGRACRCSTVLSPERTRLMNQIRDEAQPRRRAVRRRARRRAHQARRPAGREQPGDLPAHADRARARGQGAARAGRRDRRSASAPAPTARGA